jgi:hypothetical protein
MQTPARPSLSLRFFPGVRVPKYRVHAASGQARVTLSGKTYYLGTYTSPECEAEYRRVVSEWLAIGCRPAGPQPDQPTVVEVLDACWSDLQTQEPSASELDQARRAIGLMPLSVIARRIARRVAGEMSAADAMAGASDASCLGLLQSFQAGVLPCALSASAA